MVVGDEHAENAHTQGEQPNDFFHQDDNQQSLVSFYF
jgi:hypothetical protein